MSIRDKLRGMPSKEKMKIIIIAVAIILILLWISTTADKNRTKYYDIYGSYTNITEEFGRGTITIESKNDGAYTSEGNFLTEYKSGDSNGEYTSDYFISIKVIFQFLEGDYSEIYEGLEEIQAFGDTYKYRKVTSRETELIKMMPDGRIYVIDLEDLSKYRYDGTKENYFESKDNEPDAIKELLGQEEFNSILKIKVK